MHLFTISDLSISGSNTAIYSPKVAGRDPYQSEYFTSKTYLLQLPQDSGDATLS
jgi:hypothetical protein